MRKIINFTDKTLSMIDFIKESEGHNNFSATVISIISRYYDKKYYTKWNQPKNKKVILPSIPEEQMTEEQICESLGGKVERDNNGTMVCKGPIGYEGSSISAPLTLMGEKGAAGDYRIKK